MSPIRRSKYQSFFWPELKRPDLSHCLPHLLNIFTFNNSLYNNNVYCYVRDYLFSRGGSSTVASNPGGFLTRAEETGSLCLAPPTSWTFSHWTVSTIPFTIIMYTAMLCWADIFKAPSIQKLKIYIRGNNCAGQRKSGNDEIILNNWLENCDHDKSGGRVSDLIMGIMNRLCRGSN